MENGKKRNLFTHCRQFYVRPSFPQIFINVSILCYHFDRVSMKWFVMLNLKDDLELFTSQHYGTLSVQVEIAHFGFCMSGFYQIPVGGM